MKAILTIAMRGLRGARRDFLFFSWAIFLAVAAVTAMLTTAEALRTIVDREARGMLAADLRLESATPLGDFIHTHLRQSGWSVAENLEFTAMARIPDSSRTVLVEVLAAAPEHPLLGAVELRSGMALQTALQGEGAVAEATVSSRLGLSSGNAFYLGDARFQLTDVLQKEPDRVVRFFRWGPRLIIPKERVAATGLLGVGSRVQYVALVRLQPGADPEQVAQQLNVSATKQGIRVMTPADSQPSARRFMNRLTTFLHLMALLTLLTAANAMAGIMAAHVRENRGQIAIFKALGVGHLEVMGIFFWRIVSMSAPGSLAGAAVGMALPQVLTYWSGMEMMEGVSFKIPALCALAGVGAGLLFSFGPLWGTRLVGAGVLFRAVAWGGGLDFLSWKWRWGVPVAVTLIGALFLGRAGGWNAGMLFVGELAAMLILLWLAARGGVAVLQRLKPRKVLWRLAVRGLIAPGSGITGAIVSVGLGMGVMCAILFLEQNINQQMVSRLPQRVPSFFLVDLQADQESALRELASPFVRKPQDVQTTPVVRGRIRAIQEARITPEWVAKHPQSWRLNRDYVLTWSADLPEGNRLIDGRWWRDPEAQEMSVEQEMARALGVRIGDTLSFDILGVEVSATVTSLREVRWSNMGLNFFVVFSPAVLQGVPFSYLATALVETGQEEAFRSAVVQRFPNVSLIASREVMERARQMLEQLIVSVHLAGGMAVASALTALGVTVALTRRRRAKEAAIRRLLGATQRDLIETALAEHILLGVVATIVGVVIGQAITAGVTILLFNDLWDWLPLLTLKVFFLGVGVVAMTGYAVSRRDLRRPVMASLRGHD
ncbi:MAG: hypothetical protein HQL93_11865 [Magnetococcales bacterium]|nr:hypothetical protein [Magnetococcales bacterium]